MCKSWRILFIAHLLQFTAPLTKKLFTSILDNAVLKLLIPCGNFIVSNMELTVPVEWKRTLVFMIMMMEFTQYSMSRRMECTNLDLFWSIRILVNKRLKNHEIMMINGASGHHLRNCFKLNILLLGSGKILILMVKTIMLLMEL